MSCVLGTMTFGWNNVSSKCDDEKSAEMVKAFLANPQHTEIDTAFLVSTLRSEVLPSVVGYWTVSCFIVSFFFFNRCS